MQTLNNIFFWIPIVLAIIGIFRLFKDKLTFRAKIFVASLMLIAGLTPLLKLPIDRAIVKHQKLIPPQLEVNMGYSEKGNLFVVADSRNDVPYKARWVICTKDNKVVNGLMLEDVIFYPKQGKRRMQYKEEIDKSKVIDNYLELRFDYRSLYAEEMNFPEGLLGKVVKKYKTIEDAPYRMTMAKIAGALTRLD